jgi:ferrous iron transport protein B
MGMYLLGFLVALFSAAILKRFIKNKGKTYLVMDFQPIKNHFSDTILKWF